MIYILLAFLAVISCRGQLCFSIPYTTYLSEISATHRVNIEINRYPYQIDFTFNSSEDRIVSLESEIQQREPSSRPDYRKNDKSVFGIVQFIGAQHADTRLEWKRWIAYNLYYYVRDFSQKNTWINLNAVKQIPQNQWDWSKGDGSFNFGPKHSNSQILRNFKKYSKYMKDPVITFRANIVDVNGEIIFGAFPSEIVKGSVYTTALEYIGEDFWIINTISLNLKRKIGAPIELYKESVRMRFTISERTIVIPVSAARELSKSYSKCTFKSMDFQGKRGNFLSCKDLKEEESVHVSLDFTIRDAELPLSIRLTDLEITRAGDIIWFAVRSSQTQQYQIGEAILRKYAIGIDYHQGLMMYGLLEERSSLTRGIIIKVFITFNILLFLFSAILVAFEKEIRMKMKTAVQKQLGLSEEDAPSKKNLYQLASVTEDSLAE